MQKKKKQAMNVEKEIRSFNINPKNQVAQGSLGNSAREISFLRAVKNSLPRRRNKIFLCPTAYNERPGRKLGDGQMTRGVRFNSARR